ncbi:MAG: hypothetical protein M3Y59_18810 [Myxococcota bacterium]|nr:hypothetical protein [Myxococcota bacterium]
MTAANYKGRLSEPLPREVSTGAGCAAALSVAVLVGSVALLLVGVGWRVWGLLLIVAAIPALYGMSAWLRRRALILDARASWPGTRCLVVTSDSPL